MAFSDALEEALAAKGWNSSILAGELTKAGHSTDQQSVRNWLDGKEPSFYRGVMAARLLERSANEMAFGRVEDV